MRHLAGLDLNVSETLMKKWIDPYEYKGEHDAGTMFASLTLGIFNLTLGIFCPLCIIAFERSGEDPRKRSLLNKLVSSHCWNCIMLIVITAPLMMYRHLSGPLSWLLTSLYLHYRIYFFFMTNFVFTEALIVAYIFNVLLQRTKIMNDDYIHVFLKAANTILSAMLTFIQSQGDSFKENYARYIGLPEDFIPRSGQNFFLPVVMMSISILIYVVVIAHMLVQKTCESKQATPVAEISIIQPSSPEEPALIVNNSKYNKDLVGLSGYVIAFTIYVATSVLTNIRNIITTENLAFLKIAFIVQDLGAIFLVCCLLPALLFLSCKRIRVYCFQNLTSLYHK